MICIEVVSDFASVQVKYLHVLLCFKPDISKTTTASKLRGFTIFSLHKRVIKTLRSITASVRDPSLCPEID